MGWPHLSSCVCLCLAIAAFPVSAEDDAPHHHGDVDYRHGDMDYHHGDVDYHRSDMDYHAGDVDHHPIHDEPMDTNASGPEGMLDATGLPHLPPPGPRERLLRLLRLADADANREVTFEEILAVAPDFALEDFDRLDRNGDGVLSHQDLHHFPLEGLRGLLNLLDQADADGDGALTFEEMAAFLPGATGEHFDRLDRNADGVFSIEDLPPPPPTAQGRLIRLLAAADGDDNGEVTFDELQAVAPGLTGALFARLDANNDEVISPADLPQPPPDPRPRWIQSIQDGDTDGDGEVTIEELQALDPELSEEEFARLDNNQDGVLTLDDLPDSPIPGGSLERLPMLHALFYGDLNRDGVLGFAEVAAAFPDAPIELLTRIDANGDWALTRREILIAMSQADDGGTEIEPCDVDGDGKTSASDVQITVNHAMGEVNTVLPADVDANGVVDAADVQLVVIAILE